MPSDKQIAREQTRLVDCVVCGKQHETPVMKMFGMTIGTCPELREDEQAMIHGPTGADPFRPAAAPTETAAPAECLMADCVEPQAHFCVTHVLEVHAAPTDEQMRKDLNAVSLSESRLTYNNDQLRRERDELREALREFVASGVEFDDSRMNYVVMQIDREALERARKLIETN